MNRPALLLAQTLLSGALLVASAAPAFAQSSNDRAQDRAAARADSHRVRIGDLDLSSPADAEMFDRRVERVARNACQGRPTLMLVHCRRALTRELRDALPSIQREEYARGRSSRILALAETISF